MLSSFDMKKLGAYFTVDFEDFSHDLCRVLGLPYTTPRERELEEAYDSIAGLLQGRGNKSCITFFCTGVIAELYPNLLRKLASDGHEIACHGFHHDDVNKTDPHVLKEQLRHAKDLLEEISKSEVVGFRAPRFSVSSSDIAHLNSIGEVFDYDSSLHFSDKSQLIKWEQEFDFGFIEIPVPRIKLTGVPFYVKPGGSYYKLFPVAVASNAVQAAIKGGLPPILYFHPYDLYSGYSMGLSLKELSQLPTRERMYWFIRQRQWTGAFNWCIDSKLSYLSRRFENLGSLRTFLA